MGRSSAGAPSRRATVSAKGKDCESGIAVSVPQSAETSREGMLGQRHGNRVSQRYHWKFPRNTVFGRQLRCLPNTVFRASLTKTRLTWADVCQPGMAYRL